jgi:addiction module HigA family antidote
MRVDTLPPMKNPPHPGALVREDVIKELGLTVTRATKLLDISSPSLSLFLNKRIDLSPEMALKWEAAFGLEPAMLLAIQTDRNLARARER